MRLLALLPLVAVVGCSEIAVPVEPRARAPQSPGAPAYEKLVNEKDDVFAVAVTACNGEIVVLDGTVHLQIFFGMSPSGGANFRISVDYHLKGVGAVTGAKYAADVGFREKDFAAGDNLT